MPEKIFLRFYEELNDYLPLEWRKRDFNYSLSRKVSLHQILNTLGVPASEVELILVNGSSVELSHCPRPCDRISIYPVFESFDVKPVLRIRDEPLRQLRFLVDPGLQRLAFYLHMFGYDARVGSPASAVRDEAQIILTGNSALQNSGLSRVYVVRKKKPWEQLKEVLSRFDLVNAGITEEDGEPILPQ
jgi:hypothetical protein